MKGGKKSLNNAANAMCEIIKALCIHPTSIEEKEKEKEEGRDGWMAERIFLFGFSAGACLAMECCIKFIMSTREKLVLGGSICVAGGSTPHRKFYQQARSLNCQKLEKKSDTTKEEQRQGEISSCLPITKLIGTPILIMAGSKDEKYSPQSAEQAAKIYNEMGVTSSSSVQIANVYTKEGKDHGMIQSSEEMRKVMEFFSEKLVRQMVFTPQA